MSSASTGRLKLAFVFYAQFFSVTLSVIPLVGRVGAGGEIRTHEAYAAAYKTAPIDHYGTPAYVLIGRNLSTDVRPHLSHFWTCLGNERRGIREPIRFFLCPTQCSRGVSASGGSSRTRTYDLTVMEVNIRFALISYLY